MPKTIIVILVMANNLKRVVLRHYESLKAANIFKIEDLDKIRTLTDFDSMITSRAFSYATVSDYYRDASCAQYLTRIQVPTFCLSAIGKAVE